MAIVETPPPAVIKKVEPAPQTIIKAHPPAQVEQYIEFGARLQPQPQFIQQQYAVQQPQFIAQQQYAVAQPQPIYHQQPYVVQPQVFQAPYIQPQVAAPVYHQPQPAIQYTHNPAQVYHQQVHQQQVQQVLQANINPPQTFHYAPQHMTYDITPQKQIIQAQPIQFAAPQPQVVQKYEDIVIQNQGSMRYAAAPVAEYLPALQQQYVSPPQPAAFVQKVHTPVQQQYLAPPRAAVVKKVQTSSAIIKGKQNPLTFNYGYDNGVSKVTHSYFGSGW